jgi:NADPH-dependent 2,4-dienoyl-CoA reductase/sulfur reductase-like enzyme
VVETLRADVAVVGGGPAGVAAACRAAEAGAAVVLIDEGLAPGGQIHRHLPGEQPPAKARPWLERLRRSGARLVPSAAVFDAERERSTWLLRAAKGDSVLFIRASRLVLATGARELFLPFPGWTLPGVIGAGAAQSLIKSGANLGGKKAVVAGTGPLLLAAAAGLAEAGVEVAFVAEQASFGNLARFAARAIRTPGKLLEGVRYRLASARAPYRAGFWVKAAGGTGRVERAHVTDGRRKLEVECDLLCVGFGLVPNLELARLIGCATDGPRVATGDGQETGVSDVFAAGEVCGIAGVEAAVAEGEMAGLAAAGALRPDEPSVRRLAASRAKARRFGQRMAEAFRLRPEVLRLAAPDTIVCRCEDVPLGRLAAAGSMREAKLQTRSGMGPCQGRVCGAALEAIRGLGPDTVRVPVVPVPLEALAAVEGTREESP